MPLNAFLVVMLFDAIEAFEDEGEVGIRDANPVIGDPQSDLAVFVALGTDFEFEGPGGILFQGVLDEIEEDLGPVKAVTHEVEVLVDFLESDFGFLLLNDRFQTLDDVTDTARKMKGGKIEAGGLAGLQTRNHKHVVDDAGNTIAVLLHDGEGALDGRAIVDIALDEVFQITVDDGKRSAQFVRGVGDEVFADLLGLMLGGDVTDDDSGDGLGCVFIERASVDEPSGFAAPLGYPAGRGLLGKDDPVVDLACRWRAILR